MLVDQAAESMQVVSLGCGTKVVETGKNNKMRCVRDQHAEVLARRGLKKFLLGEMGKEVSRVLVSVVEEKDDICPRLQFQLQPHLTLHLYVSSAPCGNACLKRWVNNKRKEKFQS